jgi:hypothetical protein
MNLEYLYICTRKAGMLFLSLNLPIHNRMIMIIKERKGEQIGVIVHGFSKEVPLRPGQYTRSCYIQKNYIDLWVH